MSREFRSICGLTFLGMLLLFACRDLHARQDSNGGRASRSGPTAEQNDSQASPPATQDHSNPATSPPPSAEQPVPPASSGSPKPAGKEPPTQTYPLSANYSVTLSFDWQSSSSTEVPPPALLSPYAPIHLSGNLVLANTPRGAILQFATSNNPFLGHDAYWLDTQMHLPTDTGAGLLDFFFYYFFPPSDACIHQVLTTDAPASRQSPIEGPAYMQVFYSCPLSDTLSDFYATQVSAGITFRLTDNGTRVLAPVGDFYVAPMEQLDASGMTFFVFEAQGMNVVSSDAAKHFHLPDNASGGQPDFFWAIGAPTPFPFVDDPARKDIAILHVAYARLGIDTDAKSEFENILRQIRTH
jgi:hypothetical protein